MKRLRIVIAVLVILAAVSAVSADVAPLPGPFVSFDIYADGWALSRGDKSYVEGGPISIRCVWRNNGKKPARFFFQSLGQESNKDGQQYRRGNDAGCDLHSSQFSNWSKGHICCGYGCRRTYGITSS